MFVFCDIVERIADGKNGDIAVDEYHRYKVCTQDAL